MSHRELNPFYEYTHMGEEEIIDDLIQQCKQSATFQKLMERLIESDKQKYLLMLNSKGVKFPRILTRRIQRLKEY